MNVPNSFLENFQPIVAKIPTLIAIRVYNSVYDIQKGEEE